MTYKILITSPARRAMERLPGVVQDEVLAGLSTQLDDLDGATVRIGDRPYLLARVAQNVDVAYRVLTEEEARQIARGVGDTDPPAPTLVVLSVTLSTEEPLT